MLRTLRETAQLKAAIDVLDPIVALLSLVQITGDRSLLSQYGPLLDGSQDTTREAFLAVDGANEKSEVAEEAAKAVRELLFKAEEVRYCPAMPHIDMPLFREMVRLATGVELPEMSIEPAYQHAGFTTDTRVRKPAQLPPSGFKALVVGAGMIGINAAVKLKQAGIDFTILEAMEEIGGNWLTNTYPGAAVDTPSRNYSFSFAPNASWTKYYPNGSEFLSYLSRVADDFDLIRKIQFGTWVEGAQWDEANSVWVVNAVRNGQRETHTANALIMAVGPNNSPKYPNVKNLDAFGGPVIHSAEWDHSVDLTGKKVVLVGTGCSGVQVATAIADQVGSLTIVQRQPEHIMPNPQAHAPVDPLERWAMENIPYVVNWKRLQGLSSQMQNMPGMISIDEEHQAKTGGVSPLNDALRQMCDQYLEASFPDDPEMVALLKPSYPVFAKRPILDCGFYETLKKPNVNIVRGALAECDATGVILADGSRIDCDVLLLSTGYNLFFGTQFDIVGREGKTLKETFEPHPFSYEGMLIPGFPNFVFTGAPYSYLVANHAIVSEQQIHYTLEMLQWMIDENLASIEVSPEATKAFVDDVDAAIAKTTWSQCGDAHGYYRHSSGKVILAIPRHNSRIWHDLRQPRVEDFITRPAKAARQEAAAPVALSI